MERKEIEGKHKEQSKHLQGGRDRTEKCSLTLLNQEFNILLLCMTVLRAALLFQALPGAMEVAEPCKSGFQAHVLHWTQPRGTCFQLRGT